MQTSSDRQNTRASHAGNPSAIAAAALHSDAAVAACLDGLADPLLALRRLGPAARALGEDWLEDRCGFFEVALGVSRLERALRRLPSPRPGWVAPDRARSIALWAVPGDAHRFGAVALASVFRARGWFVLDEPIGSAGELEARLARTPVGLVGLSVGHERALPAFRASVDAARRACVPVLAGGACLALRPDAFGIADAVAPDADTALIAAERLLATATAEAARTHACPG